MPVTLDLNAEEIYSSSLLTIVQLRALTPIYLVEFVSRHHCLSIRILGISEAWQKISLSTGQAYEECGRCMEYLQYHLHCNDFRYEVWYLEDCAVFIFFDILQTSPYLVNVTVMDGLNKAPSSYVLSSTCKRIIGSPLLFGIEQTVMN